MMQGREVLSLFAKATLGRTETGPSVVPPANEGHDEPAPSPAAPSDGAAQLPSAFDPGVVDLLADKVLFAWLRNRYQLLFPFALDLRRLEQGDAELLVHAMTAAAQADGTFDEHERKRIEGALKLVAVDEEKRGFLAAIVDRPRPLNEVLRESRDVRTGALVYAASLMTVDQRQPVNRHYLRYLAARLQLSEELVGSLEQRFRSSG